MIKASVAYEMMEKALHLIPSHESTSTYLSAYGVFNLESGDCVAVRAANHGTFLYNWLKMQDEPFNVDLLTSANVALTFLDGSIPFSHNNNIEMDNGAEPPVFVVRQYVYNCAVLDANDINVIISASKKLIIDGVYTDPFEEDSTKHAIIYREKTNEPSKDMTAKTLKKHRAAKKKRELQQPTDNNNQELNTEQYMNKKLIRLTERDLHRIVKESVNRILKETYDPCDELGHIRWCNRDYRNNSDEAQRVGKVRGDALANWHKWVKDSESKVQEEGYTSNVSYTDANKPSNRPQIGTLDYYRRNDRMQVGQQPMYNNPNNWDNTEGWYSEGSQNRRDSQPFNANMFPRSANPMSNMAVEESVDEVMYNGQSLHGTNPNDWMTVADERDKRWERYNKAHNIASEIGDKGVADLAANKRAKEADKYWANRTNAKRANAWYGNGKYEIPNA